MSPRAAKPKPLSFSTTMRNPYRIAEFLSCVLPYENRILTEEIIMEISKSVIRKKHYVPMYIHSVPKLKKILKDDEQEFSEEQAIEIIKNSPQKHKEAGFKKGWPSRFDTWFKLPMEFGFIKYAMDEKIVLSSTGHMLVDAYLETPINERKIQNVLLNSMIKYETDNPYRKNANKNAPLILLLQVLRLLKNKYKDKHSGVSRKELSLFICWPNYDAKELFNKIVSIRNSKGHKYSDEYIYEICLSLLGADDSQRNRFKISQITGEAPDEYIRKMRSTGVISLRGGGRFLDINTLEIDKINYILENYEYQDFTSKEEYFEYIGEIDPKILEFKIEDEVNLNKKRIDKLKEFAKNIPKETIYKELKVLAGKRGSRNEFFKFIPSPSRLEFLTSIALCQNLDKVEVRPNYIIDDEGIPSFTATGGKADIICFDSELNSIVEVTLIKSRRQTNDEIIPIARHLKEIKKENPNSVAIFIAPRIHHDSHEMIAWYQYKDALKIVPHDIKNFVKVLSEINSLSELVNI